MAGDIFKKIPFYFTKAFLSLYLTSERQYRVKGMKLVVLPGVFHPGFFKTSKHLLNYISKTDFNDKSVLELGAGTGMLSVYCALKGGKVTASDVSLQATLNIDKNSRWNRVVINNIHSDLFKNISIQTFDHILINPPFQKIDPKIDSDYTYDAGKNYIFFEGLFKNLPSYINKESEVLLCTSDLCDLLLVKKYAAKHGFGLNLESTQKALSEISYIFSLKH